jgi:hypothetical protein
MKKILSLLTSTMLTTAPFYTNFIHTHAVVCNCCEELHVSFPDTAASYPSKIRLEVFIQPTSLYEDKPIQAKVIVLSGAVTNHRVSQCGTRNFHEICYTPDEMLPPEAYFIVDAGWQDSNYHIVAQGSVSAFYGPIKIGRTEFSKQIN